MTIVRKGGGGPAGVGDSGLSSFESIISNRTDRLRVSIFILEEEDAAPVLWLALVEEFAASAPTAVLVVFESVAARLIASFVLLVEVQSSFFISSTMTFGCGEDVRKSRAALFIGLIGAPPLALLLPSPPLSRILPSEPGVTLISKLIPPAGPPLLLRGVYNKDDLCGDDINPLQNSSDAISSAAFWDASSL